LAVYCKDANRRGDFPNQSFDFLGFKFRARKALGRGRRAFACFLPAASPKALTCAQQTAMPVIGFLSSRSPGESAAHEMAFRLGLKDSGYVESENVHIAFRWAEGENDRL
jgi:hypothetical protein